MEPMLEKLLEEREGRVVLIRNLQTAAVEGNHDLSEGDLEVITRAKERIAAIDNQVQVIGSNLEMEEAVVSQLARLQPGVVQDISYRCAGEVLYDVLHYGDSASRTRLDRVRTRAAQHMGTDAAQTVPVAGDLGGLVVNAVVGPILDPHDSGRPFLSAIGVRPADGEVFHRPFLVDANLDADLTQSQQKAELASYAFTVQRDTLELTTVGNYLNISQQLLRFQPQSLDIIVGQLNKRVSRSSEFAAIAELENSASTVDLAAGADGAAILAAIFQGAELVYEETGDVATWIAMGPKGLTRLGSLVDLAGRPLFPYLGAANALGTATAAGLSSGPAGLRPIQTYAITDDSFWIGNSLALEAYEYRWPLLEAVEPSVLGRQVAAAASLALYRPHSKSTTGTAGGQGAVHLVPGTP